MQSEHLQIEDACSLPCCHAPNTSSQHRKYQNLIAYALKDKGKANAM